MVCQLQAFLMQECAVVLQMWHSGSKATLPHFNVMYYTSAFFGVFVNIFNCLMISRNNTGVIDDPGNVC